MRTLVALFAGLLVATAGSANAADAPGYSGAESVMYSANSTHDWTGFYVGAMGGIASFNSNWDTIYGTYEGGPSDINPTSVARINSVGGILGVTAGYNFQVSPEAVLGIEGDIGFTNLNGSDVCLGDNTYYHATCAAKVNWLASVAGRAGFAADRTLVFGKAGLAVGSFSYDIGNFNFSAPEYNTVTETRYGMLLGAGIEQALTDTISAKVEVDYMDFGSKRVNFSSGCGTLCYSSDFGTDIANKVILGKVGINVKLQ
ncbi:MAG TPA: outer membrane beta-barrel protein [Devosiaceae bacterium]